MLFQESFTKEQMDFIRENYNKIPTKEIAAILGMSLKRVSDKAYRMGLKRELVRYMYDEAFFENIDTEEKAYWLGFIYADGCISQIFNKKTGALKSKTMEISLAERDKPHLEKLLSSLKSNKPIEQKIIRLKGIEYASCKVSINNKKICEDLMSLGCIPKKSLTIGFPKENIVSKSLLKHFIRGYFDGDGCVSYNHEKLIYIVNFVGTESMLNGIQNVVEELLGLTKTTIKEKGKAFQVNWGGFTNFKLWYKFLYEDATVFLDRKHDKFIEAISTKEYLRNVPYYHRNMKKR